MDPESERIKEEIEETHAALTKKLLALEAQLHHTVENAKETVDGTIENLRATMHKFSPSYAVQRQPLVAVGGALAAGLIFGRRFAFRDFSARPRRNRATEGDPASSYGYGSNSPAVEEIGEPHPSDLRKPSEVFSRRKPTLISRLTDTFSKEIEMSKGMLCGMAIDAVRNLAIRELPDFQKFIDRVMDSAKETVGADPKFQLFQTAELEIEDAIGK